MKEGMYQLDVSGELNQREEIINKRRIENPRVVRSGFVFTGASACVHRQLRRHFPMLIVSRHPTPKFFDHFRSLTAPFHHRFNLYCRTSFSNLQW